jgi:hypothetical protein
MIFLQTQLIRRMNSASWSCARAVFAASPDAHMSRLKFAFMSLTVAPTGISQANVILFSFSSIERSVRTISHFSSSIIARGKRSHEEGRSFAVSHR